MGVISSLYDNPAAIAAAKRARETQKRRDEKAAKRLAKMNKHRQSSGRKSKVAVKIQPEHDGYGRPIYRPGMGKSFYRTKAWLDIRYLVLQRHGAKCQCCGATKADDVKIHVDHIKPRHRFPQLELVIDNLQVLCEACNLGKGGRDETNWRDGGASTRPKLNSAIG